MYMGKKVAAILLAGGSGTRFGSERNKVYVEAMGKPLLQYSLEVFAAHPQVDEILLVTKAGEEALPAALPCGKPHRIVVGGASRQESVLHGIQATDAELVLIHDGARPLVKAAFIDSCLAAMQTCPGASVAVRSKDTIKLADESGIVQMTTRRANTWLIQTPQCFDRAVLLQAHRLPAGHSDVTDDCMLLELAGERVQLVEGDYTNIKVTTPEDLALVESFLRR